MPIECARQPVIIMGMARSGTSLVSSLLLRCGLFLGYRKIHEDEESTFFYRLNQIMLRRVHGEFDNPAPMRYFLNNSRAIEMTVKCLEADLESCRIISYLGLSRYLRYRSLQRYDRPWGWKDPLNTFTLPLWLKVFPRAKILYIVRNGVDVAHSLVNWQRPIISKREVRNRKISAKFSWRRNLELFGFKGAVRCLTLEGSFSLWEEFVAQAEDALARIDNDRKTIAYEKFLADPKTHLLELLRFCELDVGSEGIIDEVVKRVDASRSNAFLSNPGLMTFYEKVKDRPWIIHYGYHRQ